MRRLGAIFPAMRSVFARRTDQREDMPLWRIVAAATAFELAVLASLATGLGIFGFASGWLDTFNQMAPIWGAVSLVSMGLAFFSLRPGNARRLVAGLAMASVLLAGLRTGSELAAAAAGVFQRHDTSTPPLKLVSLNTWDHNTFPEGAAHTLGATGADVVLLQEISGFIRYGDAEMSKVYPHRVLCSQPWICGLVIYSKLPILSWGWQSPKPGMQDPSALAILWVTVRAPDGRPVTIVTTHYTWPFPPAYQTAQRQVLAKVIERFGPTSLILAGDMNLTPWSYAMNDQDRHLKPLTRRTRAWFSYPNMVDHVDRTAPFPLLPIDQLYASQDWTVQGLSRIEAGSDHTGMVATLVRSKR